MGSDSKSPEFEEALAELERLVEKLERGDLPLEEALRNFERGVELTRRCQSELKAAQQRVEILLRRDDRPSPFVVSEDEPASATESLPTDARAPTSLDDDPR